MAETHAAVHGLGNPLEWRGDPPVSVDLPVLESRIRHTARYVLQNQRAHGFDYLLWDERAPIVLPVTVMPP